LDLAQIAIVGNGPSRRLYRPFKGDVCVCNIPQLAIDYDYISIVDVIAFNYVKKQNLVFDKPVLTTEDTLRNIKKHNLKTEIQPVFKHKLMNSAATAAYYFTEHYDTIWLYGCDALWSNNTSSHQDTLIPRAKRTKNLHIQWRAKWEKVWKTDAQFVIVCPNKVETVNYGDNVFWNRSKT
jgi:hypothetical protein